MTFIPQAEYSWNLVPRFRDETEESSPVYDASETDLEVSVKVNHKTHAVDIEPQTVIKLRFIGALEANLFIKVLIIVALRMTSILRYFTILLLSLRGIYYE